MNKLTDEQIRLRLVEGRNHKRLYLELKDRYDKDVGKLKDENKELRQLLSKALAQNKTQAIQIAELQTMVFGKKRKPPTGHYLPNLPKPEVLTRNKNSYRRPLPPASAITSEEPVLLPDTCQCGGKFKEITVHERYVEDIPLPDLTEDYQAQLVTKYVIERGVCSSCGKVTTAKDLGGQATSLGPNIRLLICHLATVVGLSYAQIIQLANGLYQLYLTDGEIAAILAKQHKQWLPAYAKLKADVRASPVKQYDETPWKIVEADNSGYAWIASVEGSPTTVFHLATSRGAPHAKKLHGNSSGIHITDDYIAYRNLAGQQQLCWAHPYRHIRDLRYNENLSKEQLPYVARWYASFAGIYRDLKTYLDQPYDLNTRQKQSDELWQRLKLLASQKPPRSGEPIKLTRLKAQILRAGRDRWLTCLVANIPCDNNRAERDLRPLVLKRKRSFGSKSVKGAKALSTVLSVCTTTWKANKNNYFQALAAI